MGAGGHAALLRASMEQLHRSKNAGKGNNPARCKETLELYQRLRAREAKPTIALVLSALKACGNLKDLETGLRIHGYVAADSELSGNGFVANTLVDMYSKCGRVMEARQVFDQARVRDVVSWNCILMGYAQNGQGEAALELFRRMKDGGPQEGCVPNSITLLAAVRACSSMAAKEKPKLVDGRRLKVSCLANARLLKQEAVNRGFETNLFLNSALLDLFAKCGSMQEAMQLFEGMPGKDAVSWTSVILGHVQNGECEMALQLYDSMLERGLKPDAMASIASIKACARMADRTPSKAAYCLEKGRSLHRKMSAEDLESVPVANALVDMYAKCRCMLQARQVFDEMTKRDDVSWNCIITGYAQNGDGDEALELYQQMQDAGFTPTSVTYLGALKACICIAEKQDMLLEWKGCSDSSRCLEIGREIHRKVAETSIKNISVASTLVDMYSKCGSVEEAWDVFREMPRHDVISWNCIIVGYALNGKGKEALRLFEAMQEAGFTPDGVTYVGAIKGCACLADSEQGMFTEARLVKSESLELGRSLHNRAVDAGYGSNNYVGCSLVEMYARCGSIDEACGVFDGMQRRDIVAWNCIISKFANAGEGDLALQYYARMREEGCVPNAITFAAALKACGAVGALPTGRMIHDDIRISNTGLELDASVATSLVDFYGKCGSMAEAEEVFRRIRKRDTVAWNALMWGYSRQGNAEAVFTLFERMQAEDKQKPNEVVFLSLLSACSHVGLVDKGREFFELMVTSFGIPPHIDHCSCMVDMLGRANRLQEALQIVRRTREPNVSIWMALLSAACKWRDVDVGRVAFNALVKMDEKHASPYVMMSNLCASVGLQEESWRVHQMRVESGAWKKRGRSWWTDESGRVHCFSSGDASDQLEE